MSLRLIEIYHRDGKADTIDSILKDAPVIEMWHDHLPEGETISKILLRAENTDSVLHILEDCCIESAPLRVVILPVEATLPRPEEPETAPHAEPRKEKSPERISTEELYQKMSVISDISRKYIIMAILASFVAAIGLLNNDVAVIIGSMVIAPLLSPNMGLALATTLADSKLASKAIRSNISGFFLVLSISTVMGFIMTVDPAIPQIASRSNVSLYYIFLALACGVAGAYSITTGVAEALVGVMVAVAILPPLVAAGLLFGASHWKPASSAFLLFFVNVVSVNLTGVITFALQGIRPKNWWHAEQAQKAVWISVSIWVSLLILLALMILLEQRI